MSRSLLERLGDRYELADELGRGGMSVVYAAVERATGRRLAIKVLREDFSSAAHMTRFHREVALGASLRHDNIVPILDWGEFEGQAYCIMPRVEGESLREILDREGALPVERAVQIVSQVADALEYAHAQGIVHRDVKPGNILISGDRASLADFGIARALAADEDTWRTSSGVLVGTPAYMSPEHASGSDDIDARSDVYSLACVLFHTLAGEPPFTGRTAQAVIARHVLERVPSVEVVRPGLRPSLGYAVARGMAKAKVDRFASVAELREAMHSDVVPAEWRREEVPSSAPPEPRGTGLVTRAAGAAAVAAIVVLAFWRPWAPGGAALDDRHIVGFPLVELGTPPSFEGTGEILALGIGSALEAAAPLRWTDGWRWLQPAEREDLSRLTPERADALAATVAARYRLEGQVVVQGDSASVILTLFDVARQREAGRRTERGGASIESLTQLAIRGTLELLPAVLEPGREVDVLPLLDHDAGAVALLMMGNREFRSSRFTEALDFYERSVAIDSVLAEAALGAARSASWLDEIGLATRYAEVASAASSGLSDRQRDFAAGLRAYLGGSADTALAALRSAATAAPDWPDAHFALGEVLRHLMPRVERADTLAEAAYAAAVEADPTFTPALFHLAEIGLWRGRVDQARTMARRFREAGAVPARVEQLELMLDCAEGGVDNESWAAVADPRPAVALEAAYSLLPVPDLADCAMSGFRGVLAGTAPFLMRMNALVGLQSLLVAAAGTDSLRSLIPGAMEDGIGLAVGLYVVDATAGAPFDEEAEAFVASLPTNYAERPTNGLWLVGQWAAHRGDVGLLNQIAEVLEGRASSAGPDTPPEQRRANRLQADIASAHLAAQRGDVNDALARFERLRANARRPDISWTLWESLAYERIVHAELLLRAGRLVEAEGVAAELDHPAPAIYRAFQPRSLDLRIEAAEGRGDARAVEEYRRRLDSIRRGGRA